MVLEIDGTYDVVRIPAFPSHEDRQLIPEDLWDRLLTGWIRMSEQHLCRVQDDNQRIENADILEISDWLASYLKAEESLRSSGEKEDRLRYLIFTLGLTTPFGIVLKPQAAWRFVLEFFPKNSRPVINLLGGNPDLADVAALGLLEHARADPSKYASYYSQGEESPLVILRTILEIGNRDKLEPLSQLFVGQKWLVNTLAAFPTETDYSRLNNKQKDLCKALLYIVAMCMLSVPHLSYFEKLLRSALLLDLKKKYHLAAVLLCGTNFIDLVTTKFSGAPGYQGVHSVLNMERDRLSEKPQIRFPFSGEAGGFSVSEAARGAASSSVSDTDAHNLMDLFPQFNLGQAKTLIQQHGAEGAMEYILSNPDVLENPSNVQEYVDAADVPDFAPVPVPAAAKPKYIFGKKALTSSFMPDEETKSSTLQHALRMIYESDEDERDDTYEATEGVDEEESQANAKLDRIQQYLFQIYSSNNQAFDKSDRKSKTRSDLKKTTEWSDEQIEGWARMLERNPRQFKMLERKQMDGGVSKKENAQGEGNDGDREKRRDNKGKGKNDDKPLTPQQKEQLAAKQKEKLARDRRHKTQNKSSTHHRKSGHDRKMGKANFAE